MKMEEIEITKEEFFNLSTEEIAQIVKQKGKPKVGIFVPDGNRRMTMTLSKLNPETDEFFYENARITTQYFKGNLNVIFNHGLKTLFVPLISSNVFKRGKRYLSITLLEGLKQILHSKTWLNFYEKNDIRVNFYGNLEYLKKTDSSIVMEWIQEIKNYTAKHKTHNLLYGFLSPNIFGIEFTHWAIDFYKKYGREPTYPELVKSYYGKEISHANFFIMSTKLAGLGALPPFISGQETQLYFLVAPGVLALTQHTYREILYDLLFCRPNKSNNEYTTNDMHDLESLRQYYLRHNSTVIGLGRKIGKFCVPDIQNI